jgi:photosystem II stability/assembly factor-like uncharacterized protein
MKYFPLLLVSIAFTVGVSAQSVDTSQVPVWIDMMQDPNANFFETQRAFERYWDGRPREKGDGYKVFKRWEWYWSQRVDEQGFLPAPNATAETYEAWRIAYNQQMTGIESEGGDWVEVGPRFKPTNGTGQPNGNGRVNYIAFHPSNQNIFWVGSPSGGLWKTVNGGVSWTTLTDNLPTLGVSSILIDSTNLNVIYIGTGDRDAGDAPGLGVYKSTNGGQSFNASNSGMGTLTVGQMLMHPTNSNLILAATSGGIFRSTNAGSSWTLVSPNADNFKDMQFKPNDPNVVYATETSGAAGLWRSTNAGQTWSPVSNGLPGNGQRFAIGVTPADPNVVYILCSIGSEYGGLYLSTDAGLSFSTQSTSPNILSWSESPPSSGGGGQGWYDLPIAIDPNDEDVVYVGGVNIFKSSNAGVSWDCSAHWVGSATAASVHADHHWLAFSPLNGRLYDCNDGGVYYTSNGGSTWPEISDSLGISQIYKIGVSQNTHALVINGYQDNGTAIWDNTSFRTERGGDGMECIIDPGTDNVMYASVYFGNIARSTNNGFSFGTFAGENINGITEGGAWVTPYIVDQNDPEIMFIGYKNVWRTLDAYASTPTFTAISNSLAGSNSSNMRQLRQSKVNPNRLFALRSDNKLFRSDNALGSSPTWTDLTSNLPSGSTIVDVETSPNNNNKLWIIRSNMVYQSTDGGSNWSNISGNLPAISKNCLVADPYTNGGLYVGTDAGVYYKDNNLSSWVPFDDGLPTTAEITELEIYHVPGDWSARRLRAGTYGRGLWESDLYDPGNWPPFAIGDYELNGASACDPGVLTLLSTSAYGVDSLHWSVYPSSGAVFVNNTTANSNPAKLTFTEPGFYDVYLYVENNYGADSALVINNFQVTTPAAVLLPNAVNAFYCEGDTAIITSNIGMSSYNFYLNGVLIQVGGNNVVTIPNVEPNDVVSVEIIDPNGCTDDTQLDLNVQPSPTSVLTSNAGFDICEGDTVTFNNNGQGLASQTFMLNSNPVQAGNTWTTDDLVDGDSVRVALTDTVGCTGLSNLVIMDVFPLPATPTILNLLDSLQCTVVGDFYQWKRNDTTTMVTSQAYPNPNDATYTVRLYENGCWSLWSEPIVVTGTGVSELEKLSLIIYPSPAHSKLFIRQQQAMTTQVNSIQLIDMSGRTVLSIKQVDWTGESPLELDIQHLATGVYSILIETDREKIALPIVKEMR